MKAFEGYAYTYYAQRDVIAVNLGADFTSESCKAGVRDALAFLAERDGPYLVH